MGWRSGGWFGGVGVDFLEQVAVSVKKAAVHCGGPGDRGHGNVGAFADGTVQSGDHALAAACGVALSPVGHGLGPCMARRGGSGVCGVGRGHALASEVGLAGRGETVGMVGMPSGTECAAR